MQEKRFDILRKKAENFEVQPPEHLFDAILKRMAEERPNRALAWLWGSAGLGAAAAIGGLLFLFPWDASFQKQEALHVPSYNTPKPSQTSPKPRSEKAQSLVLFSSGMSNDSLGFFKPNMGLNQQANFFWRNSWTEIAPEFSLKNPNAPRANPFASQTQLAYVGNQSHSEQGFPLSSGNKVSNKRFGKKTSNRASQGKTSMGTGHLNKRPKGDAHGEAPDSRRKGDADGQAPKKDRQREEPEVHIPNSDVVRMEPKVNIPEPSWQPYPLAPIFRPKGFSMRLWSEFGAYRVHQRLAQTHSFQGKESTMINAQQHFDQRENFNAPDFAFSAGAGAAFGYRWGYFKTGLQYLHLNYQEESFRFSHYAQTVYSTVVDSIHFTTLNGNDTTVVVHQQQGHLVDAVDTNRISHRSRVEYLQIPLVLGARYERGPWFAELEAGIHLSIRTTGKALGYMQNDASNMAPYSSLEADRWRDVGADFVAGIGLGWKFNRRWEAMAGVRMQYGLSSIYAADEILDQRYHMVGGSLSLRYIIR